MQFDWREYMVFAGMLAVSALIGVYYGFINKRGQDTVSGYLLGGKQMQLLPVSLSLISGFISGITILGYPTEVYTYGTQYLANVFSYFITAFITAFVFVPVFFKLQLISVNEYLELRFNRVVRTIVSGFYTVSLLTWTPVVIYGPALALNQVSGLNVHVVSMGVCLICIFYTSVGGLKAVVWTDAIQGVMMLFSVITVAAVGVYRIGGFSYIFDTAAASGRLEMFNFDPNPTIRMTFWTAFLGNAFNHVSFAFNPSSVQRFISMATVTEAKWSVFVFCTGVQIFVLLSGFMGLIIYAAYQGCDPLHSGAISRPDQILPFFILDKTGDLVGLPGLFLAGVVSAALSSMSAGLNTVSGTFYEDFVEPRLGKTSEKRASNIMKMLVVIFGIICALLVAVIEKLGAILELSNSFGGLTSGAISGIFLLGIFFPHANSTGATVGGIVSLVTMSWVLIGSRMAISSGAIVYPVKPISTEMCANITTLVSNITSSVAAPGGGSEVLALYRVSFVYYSAMGCMIVIVVGLVVSFLTGPNKPSHVNKDLLSPLIHPFIPTYQSVPLKEMSPDPIKA